MDEGGGERGVEEGGEIGETVRFCQATLSEREPSSRWGRARTIWPSQSPATSRHPAPAGVGAPQAWSLPREAGTEAGARRRGRSSCLREREVMAVRLAGC